RFQEALARAESEGIKALRRMTAEERRKASAPIERGAGGNIRFCVARAGSENGARQQYAPLGAPPPSFIWKAATGTGFRTSRRKLGCQGASREGGARPCDERTRRSISPPHRVASLSPATAILRLPWKAAERRDWRQRRTQGMAQNAKSFPGRLTLEQWLALPFIERVHLVHQAQCDLWGSFRYCRRKNCRRHRT